MHACRQSMHADARVRSCSHAQLSLAPTQAKKLLTPTNPKAVGGQKGEGTKRSSLVMDVLQRVSVAVMRACADGVCKQFAKSPHVALTPAHRYGWTTRATPPRGENGSAF